MKQNSESKNKSIHPCSTDLKKKKGPRPLNRKEKMFSTNFTGITGYQYAKEWYLNLTSHQTHKLTKT